jgi:hypothetical protein
MRFLGFLLVFYDKDILKMENFRIFLLTSKKQSLKYEFYVKYIFFDKYLPRILGKNYIFGHFSGIFGKYNQFLNYYPSENIFLK